MWNNLHGSKILGAVLRAGIACLAVHGFGGVVLGTPRVFLSPEISSVGASESIEIQVFLEDVVDLRLYEIVLEVTGGSSGSLDLTNLTIEQARPDFVFAGLSPLVCLPDPNNLRITCSPLSDDCVTVAGTPAYLGTYTFTASPVAHGVFNVNLVNEPTSFLLDCNGAEISPITLTHGLVGVGVAIPTISEWGLAAMMLLMLILGSVVLRRPDSIRHFGLGDTVTGQTAS